MSKYRNQIHLIFIVVLLILTTQACGKISFQGKSEIPDKILFIGNSFTYYKGGLEHHIMQLANSADPPLVIQADSEVWAGKSLEWLWNHSKARKKISEGDYDVVILQDALHDVGVDSFHKHTRLFVEEIRETGAEPVLFMTWARRKLSTEEIAQAYIIIAEELDVDVAPVGLAWKRAMEERPDLNMYHRDRLHPSIHGSYLTVNVFYATIFGNSPVGLSYLPTEKGGVTEEEAAFLQRIAWETVQNFEAGDSQLEVK